MLVIVSIRLSVGIVAVYVNSVKHEKPAKHVRHNDL